MTASSDNPLVSDAKLQKLLSKIETIDTEKDFIKWRKSFLKVFTSHLDPNGVLNAKDANYRLLKKLEKLIKRCHKVQALMEDGNIHLDSITAEGRRGVTNLSEELKIAENAIHEFLPKTSADEEQIGYNKFELGAVLVEDGFHGYDWMVQSRTFVETTTTTNNNSGSCVGILDNSNYIQIVQYYVQATEVFVQVMEDLGLFRILQQCVDVVYKDKKRKTPKMPTPLTSSVENDNDPTLTKTTKTVTTTKKTKNKKDKGKNRKKDAYSSAGLDYENNNNETKPDKSPTKRDVDDSGHSRERSLQGSALPINIGEINLKVEDEEEGKEEENNGQGDEPECIFYFDPKTDTLGMIDQQMCVASFKLLVDLADGGRSIFPDENLVEDDNEKQQLIWLLKKLEKTKPVEKSWLEEIKEEKAARRGELYEKKNQRKLPSTNTSKRRSTTDDNLIATTRRDVSSTKNPVGPGFRDPFPQASSSSGDSKPAKKKTVENYLGKYKQAAAKPAEGGWKKIS